jgi:hypothetical protein
MDPDLDWSILWLQVAARFSTHLVAGRQHLLNEHTLRAETIAVLEMNGVRPGRLAVEFRAPELLGGSLDLVVDPPAGTVIEFKFPRDSSGTSADTMTLGELLRDFLRVSAVPAEQRWVVQILSARMRRYLDRVGSRYPLSWVGTMGDVFKLRPETLAGLPKTAVEALGGIGSAGVVRARCMDVVRIGQDLQLIAYLVDPVDGPVAEPTLEPEPEVVKIEAGQTREGARSEILRAARAVLARKGSSTFTMSEIVVEMHHRGTGYADSTIRTMIGSHLCADSMGDGVAPYEDLERVDRGHYRLR